MCRLQPLFVSLSGPWLHHDGQRRDRTDTARLGQLSNPSRGRRRLCFRPSPVSEREDEE